VQATYNGRPLYYFAEDFNAGDTNGHQFEEFGGDWYLVTPTGREVGGKIASGGNSQGGENCGCYRNVAQAVVATHDSVLPGRKSAPLGVISKASFQNRFAWAFDPETPPHPVSVPAGVGPLASVQ